MRWLALSYPHILASLEMLPHKVDELDIVKSLHYKEINGESQKAMQAILHHNAVENLGCIGSHFEQPAPKLTL